MKNKEPIKDKDLGESAGTKYAELYDSAPLGYFTLSNKGLIVELNNSGAKMVGMERTLVGKKNFDFFLSNDSKPGFRLFLEQIFKNKVNATCDVTLSNNGNALIFLTLTGIIAESMEQCYITATDITSRKQMEDAYVFLMQCGYSVPGEDFFESLARYLSQNLCMEYVCIDRLDPDGLTAHTVAIYNEAKFETNVSYTLKDTPCGDVVGKTVCCFPEDVCCMFPDDKTLKDLKAISYVGTTLWSFDGRPIGLIAVIGQKPLKNPNLAETLLKMFAVRAAAELERKLAEEELKKSEIRLRKYVDYAPHGIFVANQKGDYIDVNPTACKITGYTRDELLSMNLIQLVPKYSLEKAGNHFKKVVAEGFATDELPFIRKDKSLGYWLVDATKLSDQTFLGFVVDVSSHKQAEEKLIENERLLRESQNVASIGCYATDLKTRTWKASPEIYNIFGIDESYPNTLQAWSDIIHPESQTLVAEYLNQVEAEKKRFDFEYKIIRFNDGQERWVHGLGEFEYDSEFIPSRIIGTIQDITERKLAEEELKKLNEELEERVKDRTSELLKSNEILRQTEEKYRTVADFTYDWEYWISEEKEIQYMSPSVGRITGYSVDEFKSNPFLINQIVFADDLEKWESHKAASHNPDLGDNHYNLDFRVITKSGEIRWIGHVCRSVFVNGKYMGIRVSNRDITEKVQAENELLNATVEVEVRERNNFARELHDGLGPLLSTIKLYFQWLTETNDADKIKIISEKGNNNIDIAIQTTREIAIGLNTQFLNNSGYVEAVTNFIQRINDTKKITIDFNFNSNDRFGYLLETTLYRITTELINNTLKYAKATTIDIEFNHFKGIELLTFFYADNGVGFDISQIEKTSKGLGLLSINQRIKILRGSVKMDSKIGEGMSVFIEVPVNQITE